MSGRMAPVRRRKPQEFHLPDGRKVIVTLPEELETLRQKYANQDAIQVEIVVHGSDEHHQYLRETHDHHQGRREQLRQQHGHDVFEEIEDIHHQLNTFKAELDRISSDHTGLHANFNKFGFDAKLRTYDDDSHSGPGSARASVSDWDSEQTVSWDDPRPGETTKLFKRPVIKQWFHRGLLWRASEHTEIMAIELFFDLLYVGIVHTSGETVAETPNGKELLRFIITFMMSWKIWADVAQFISWFESDDVLTRLLCLVEIACLFGLTTNMTYCFADDDHDTYVPMVAFYLTARFKNCIEYILTGVALPMIRGFGITMALPIIMPCALLIGSIYVPMPNRVGLIIPALLLDHYSSVLVVAAFFSFQRKSDSWFTKRFGHYFEFYPALNIEHRVERTNAFVSLVLGYSVVGVMFQSHSGNVLNAFLGKAILGLVQAFVFNWIYFDIDASNINLHAIRRSPITSGLWHMAHLPFAMSYILASAALSKLVLATDVPNAHAENLGSHYAPLAEDHIKSGIRYFYCHGLAVALLCMAAIAWSHEHRRPPTLRWEKPHRLLNRLAVCVILFLLPLAKNLRSIDLITISMSLVTWVLVVELWGKSCKCDPFIGNKPGCKVRYRAYCRKKELDRALKKDEEMNPKTLDVEVLALGQKEKTSVPN